VQDGNLCKQRRDVLSRVVGLHREEQPPLERAIEVERDDLEVVAQELLAGVAEDIGEPGLAKSRVQAALDFARPEAWGRGPKLIFSN
jgi:hypothetical protein